MFSCSSDLVYYKLGSNRSFWRYTFSLTALIIPPHACQFKYSYCAVQAMEVAEVVATKTVEVDTVEEAAVVMVVAVEDTAAVVAMTIEAEDVAAATVVPVAVVVRSTTKDPFPVDSVLMMRFNIY